MALLDLFRKDPLKEACYRIYQVAGEQSRNPAFYEGLAVQDDFDGRFDMLVIHVHLLIRRLRSLSSGAKDAQQRLFDIFIGDLDQGLRLSGVGDIGIGHRVKKMTHAYYGRAVAYDEAMDAADVSGLEGAVRRNLYREREVSEAVVSAVASYMMAQERNLAALNDDALLAAENLFPGLPEMPQ